MIFNSYQFWAFFALVALAYRFLGHRQQNHLLLAASYFFYACWDWRFLGLIIGITAVHYVAALKIGEGDEKERRRWLVGSVAISLLLLGIFSLGYNEQMVMFDCTCLQGVYTKGFSFITTTLLWKYFYCV